MNILIISPSFYPAIFYGGPIQSTYDLAKALKRSSDNVRVLTTNANGNEKLKIKTGVWNKLENDLPVKYYKSIDSRGTSLSMLWNLWSEINNTDIVYLVSIFSAPTPFTIFICKFLKKHLIISPRGQLGKWCLEQGNPFKKLWLRLFIQPITQLVRRSTKCEGGSSNLSTEARSAKEDQSFYWHLTSEKEEQDVLSVYPSAKTFVIPNGVSEELFSLNVKPKDKSFYNKYTGFDCSNKKIIISMGRLQKVKGFDILIEAVAQVLKEKKDKGKSDDVVLLIAGEDFGERKNLEELIDKLGLKEKVFLVGRIEGMEKIEFLRNADLFALASHHENFGMVYAEALAAGTPVIASKNVPWQDVEKHNCGKWIDNSPDEFAKAIDEILISDYVQMGIDGSDFIKRNYDWSKIAYSFINKVKSITVQ